MPRCCLAQLAAFGRFLPVVIGSPWPEVAPYLIVGFTLSAGNYSASNVVSRLTLIAFRSRSSSRWVGWMIKVTARRAISVL